MSRCRGTVAQYIFLITNGVIATGLMYEESLVLIILIFLLIHPLLSVLQVPENLPIWTEGIPYHVNVRVKITLKAETDLK